MTLQSLAMIDEIALASRWGRFRMFMRYASGWIVVPYIVIMGMIALSIVGFLTDDPLVTLVPDGLICIAIVAAVLWFETRNAYQRLALFGGVVIVQTKKDKVPTAWLARMPPGSRYHDHGYAVSLELVIRPLWSRKEPHLAFANVSLRLPSSWYPCIVNGMYGVTDVNSVRQRSESIAYILDVLCYGTVQEWRDADHFKNMVFESS